MRQSPASTSCRTSTHSVNELLKSLEGVSVVTTTYNEANYVKPFTDLVRAALAGVPNEIIIVDDSSPDGTYDLAVKYADKAIKKVREGQTKGLLVGIEKARYPTVVTLDIDLENPPELIPTLLHEYLSRGCGVLVACRTRIPRFSERLSSKLIGRDIGARDVYSNFRVYSKNCVAGAELRLGETFGAELLLIAKERGCKICEYIYDPPPRREKPRVGGTIKANLRVLYVLAKLKIAIMRGYGATKH